MEPQLRQWYRIIGCHWDGHDELTEREAQDLQDNHACVVFKLRPQPDFHLLDIGLVPTEQAALDYAWQADGRQFLL